MNYGSNYVRDYKAVWRVKKAKNAARLPEPDAVADALIQIVSDRHGVAVEYIHATCRKKSAGMVKARRLVVLALRCGGYSYPRIGRQLGYRDHTAAWVSAHAATEAEQDEALELWETVGCEAEVKAGKVSA